MKRCLVLSDSFKGTLSSPDICRIARSLHIPGWHIDALPVADGGEGTTDCFLDACGGQRIALPVSGPFGGTIDGIYGLLAALPQGDTVMVDPAGANCRILGSISAHVLEQPSPVLLMKAVKTPQEMQHVRQAHIRDGAAVCRFIRWLQETVARGD